MESEVLDLDRNERVDECERYTFFNLAKGWLE